MKIKPKKKTSLKQEKNSNKNNKKTFMEKGTKEKDIKKIYNKKQK